MLKQAYGEHSLSQAQVFLWHRSLLKGREYVEFEHRLGRINLPLFSTVLPSNRSKTDDNIKSVNTLVRSNRRLILRMLCEQLNLNRFTIHQMLTKHLHTRKICAKMVPKNLIIEQDNRGHHIMNFENSRLKVLSLQST